METVKGLSGWLVCALSMLLYSIGHVLKVKLNKIGGSMNIVNTVKKWLSKLVWLAPLVVVETAGAVLTSFAGGSLLA